MVIRRWYPFNELRRMQQGMDQFWRGFPQHNGGGAAGNWWAIPLDVVQEGDAFIVQASMPGVNPADINVSIENDVLTIRGSRPAGPSTARATTWFGNAGPAPSSARYGCRIRWTWTRPVPGMTRGC